MKISDVNTERLQSPPVERRIIFQGSLASQGFMIHRIELLRYLVIGAPADVTEQERVPERSLLTALVETDKGLIEMKYLEGNGGSELLESASTFLRGYGGINPLVNRAILEYLTHYSEGAEGE